MQDGSAARAASEFLDVGFWREQFAGELQLFMVRFFVLDRRFGIAMGETVPDFGVFSSSGDRAEATEVDGLVSDLVDILGDERSLITAAAPMASKDPRAM
eukprot:CAMPEP_0174891610 /NCGR_PEP_ID=MMETSP0167-20121228/6674_1 /TAXON_ID=38298 /ORGANISM="Rhodella maculata, Strain CCMP736" /LENGTH=99 /DNA_ID=CAMNT_0016129859 /DNA_START=542 /DNA_END=841 /DNA_ORIENTATION=-